MKKLLEALLCITMILFMEGCSTTPASKDEDKPDKLNGEIKEILNDKGWDSVCCKTGCVIVNKDYSVILKQFDDFNVVKKDTKLTDDELNKHLEWMNTRLKNEMLNQSELIENDKLTKVFNNKSSNKDEKVDKSTESSTKNEEIEESKETKSNSSKTTNQNKNKENNENEEKEEISNNTNKVEKNETQKPENTISTEKSNALQSAKNYINTMPFSRSGLIQQLTYEGFSSDAASYASDNCGADWYQQAIKSAKNYLDLNNGFSQSGLLQQLEYDDFTTEQATYGVNNSGANWNNEAAISAKNYIDLDFGFSKESLIEQLLYDGYTQEQAEYGAQSVGY